MINTRKGFKLTSTDKDKRIADLERKLEQTEKELAISEHDREHNDYELVEVYKKVEQLEKENAKLKKQLDKARDIINCLVHLGEFNENTDEEYLNYQVHDVLKQAENFLKE